MPIGLFITKWDARTGMKILAKYPEESELSKQSLMQIVTTHEYSGESGILNLMVGSLNIASYYTGSKNNIYILLILDMDDDPDAYEEGLIDISRIILGNIENEAFLQMIPSLFKRLSVYPTFSIEQRLALIYQDELKRMTIKRLRDECVVSKSELAIWLKDRDKQGLLDVDNLLIELVKREIVKETSVKGMSSALIFLIKDIVTLRLPPQKILSNPSDRGLPSLFVKNYKTDVKSFFQHYKITEEDNLRLLELLIEPQAFEILRLLRTAVVTKNDLNKLRMKGVEDLDGMLKMLGDLQIMQIYQDKGGNEYYALLSDFHIGLIFPKYLLNVIKTAHDNKFKTDQVLVEYLTVFENSYMNLKSIQKEAAKIKE